MFILRILSIVLTIITISAVTSFGQLSGVELRSVHVVSADSVIKTTACYQTKKQKPKSECTYYWYESGKVNHNTGGYSGKPLHGKYEVFDDQQKLKVKGTFEYGLMSGSWIRWYSNGNIYNTCTFKDGMLHGRMQTYSKEGKLCSVLNYHNGMLQGKAYFFFKDTTIVKKYRSGMEHVKTKKSKKPQKTDFKIKSQDQHKDSLGTEERTREKWWKLSFLKRKSQKTDKN